MPRNGRPEEGLTDLPEPSPLKTPPPLTESGAKRWLAAIDQCQLSQLSSVEL